MLSRVNRAGPVILFWLLLANLAYFWPNPISWIVTLGFFLVVPGYLTLKVLNIPKLAKWDTFSFSLGLSILLIILAALFINQLTYVGVSRPLNTPIIFAALDSMTLLLMLSVRKKINWKVFERRPQLPSLSLEEKTISALALLLPLLGAFGAIRLNNGASNILTMTALAITAILLSWIVIRKIDPKIHIPVLICMALSILFAVSLRSLHITGHDVQTEFYVFQLVLQNQHWDIASYRDAYNACLSITLLPTMINQITSIDPVAVYKIVFQCIFALVLIPIYRFSSQFLGPRLGLIASFIFISFPTFLNDMPMLNRQEIGFIFFALLVLASTLPNLSRYHKSTLSLMALVGLILSHYSSTYIALAVLLIAKIVHVLLTKRHKHIKTPIQFHVISLRLIVIAGLTTFLWNSQITNTGDGLSTTIRGTIASALDNSGAQSTDVTYAIFSRAEITPDELLKKYEVVTESNDSQLEYVSPPILSLTGLGRFISSHGINVVEVNGLIKQLSATLLQLLLGVGMIVMAYRSAKKREKYQVYMTGLCAGAATLLVLQVVLPQLSVNYGTLRLLQQMLILLSIPITIGVLALMKPLFRSNNVGATAIFFSLLFLVLSSFVSRLTGGYPPVLSLDNDGIYYNAYYVHDSEVDSAEWLTKNAAEGEAVRMGTYSRLRFVKPIKEHVIHAADLTSTKDSGYVYEMKSNLVTGTYDTTVDGTRIRYLLKGNLSAEKNEIYANKGSVIYK